MIEIFAEQTIEVTPEPTPEPEAEGVSIVLYDRLGAPITYEGVDTITTDTPESGEQVVFTYGEVVNGVEVELDLQNGNQTLSVPYGNLLRKAVIKKPDTLIPENIRKDVSIGGVTGTLVGTGVEKTVELDMTDGDQTIEPDEDTLLSKVVVTKPNTLVPENIAKGIEIGGVTGTASVSDFDFSDEKLKYLCYQIDTLNKQIILTGILYERLYEDTGNYDVDIPDKIGNYDVVIMSIY